MHSRSIRQSRSLFVQTIRRLHCSRRMDEESGRLRDLLAKFQDPNSPYHIPPGTTGPSGPDDHSSSRPTPPRNSPPTTSTRPPKSKKTLWGPGIEWTDPEDNGASNGASFATAPASPSSSSVSSELDAGDHETHPPFRANAEQLENSRIDAKQYFAIHGFDPLGMTEVPVAWGECDMFQHVNNVNYVRYIETARINWAETMKDEVGEKAIMDMLQGRGIGFILKDISVRYRHPVTYPDTLLIASRPHGIEPERASFKVAHALWSLKDNKLAATADSTLVMYDYDRKKKGYLEGPFGMALLGRSGGR